MRLGCEAFAIDINPVAWSVLKCTLEHPQKLAGQSRPLPGFAAKSAAFMERFLKGRGKLTKKQHERELDQLTLGILPPPEADLAWHVRAWGRWVLEKSKADLDAYYPTIEGKPTVAYLWPGALTCKNCRNRLPPAQDQMALQEAGQKRVLFDDEIQRRSDRGPVFGVQTNVPLSEGSAAQRGASDKQKGAGTMNRSGATPSCLPDNHDLGRPEVRRVRPSVSAPRCWRSS